MTMFERRPVPLATLTDPTDPSSPWVLSYFVQRRIAGWIGILLPIVIVILTAIFDRGRIPDSISASYYTLGRNYFVGSLCAVGIFFISGVGYDEDRLVSFFAGAMAFAVAFSPCTNPATHTAFHHSNYIHGVAASLLFVDLAWMCCFRFTRTASSTTGSPPVPVTSRKRTRNAVYRTCGIVMFVTMAAYAVIAALNHFKILTEPKHALLVVEWICLTSFGLAWLTKGQQLLADVGPAPTS